MVIETDMNMLCNGHFKKRWSQLVLLWTGRSNTGFATSWKQSIPKNPFTGWKATKQEAMASGATLLTDAQNKLRSSTDVRGYGSKWGRRDAECSSRGRSLQRLSHCRGCALPLRSQLQSKCCVLLSLLSFFLRMQILFRLL